MRCDDVREQCFRKLKKLKTTLKMAEMQVGGHKGSLRLVPDGGVIFKPDRENECQFYELAQTTPLKTYLPAYFGKGVRDFGYGEMRYFKMENLLDGYNHPCVIDLKIGKRCWYEGCTEQQIKTKTKLDNETTTAAFGVRFCGMKLYEPMSQCYVTYDKRVMTSMHTKESIQRTLKIFLTGNGIIDPSGLIQISPSQVTYKGLRAINERLNSTEVTDPGLLKAMVEKLVPQLRALRGDYTASGFELISSSVFLFYDHDDPLSTLKLKIIDFAHWHGKEQKSTEHPVRYEEGIDTIIDVLMGLIQC